MAKRKKKKSISKEFLKTGLTLGAGSLVIGSLPRTAATTPLLTNIGAGFERGSTVFPLAGGLLGTAFTINIAGKVVEATKKLDVKKKRKKNSNRNI